MQTCSDSMSASTIARNVGMTRSNESGKLIPSRRGHESQVAACSSHSGASDSRALLEFLRDFAWRPTFSSKGFTGKCSLGGVALELRYKAQHPMSDSTERSRPGYVVRGVCDLYTAPTITPVT